MSILSSLFSPFLLFKCDYNCILEIVVLSLEKYTFFFFLRLGGEWNASPTFGRGREADTTCPLLASSLSLFLGSEGGQPKFSSFSPSR